MKIKTSRAEQEKIDTIQPFLDNGKRNPKFEKFYGRLKPLSTDMGDAQQGKLDEMWEREKGASKTKKIYI